MLTEHMNTLKALAEALLEKEVLEGSEIDRIIQQASIPQAVPV
jgi:cell division protease FtsH